MRKTIIALIAIFAAGTLAFPEIKIGVINPQKIMGNTKKGIEITKKLEKLQNQKQSQIQALQDEIKKLENELNSPALNNDARAQKGLTLQQKQTSIKRFVEDARAEFSRESQIELMALEKELMPLIENLGKQKGFTIIFDISRPGIVYFDQSVDLTDEVIKAVDAKYPK